MNWQQVKDMLPDEGWLHLTDIYYQSGMAAQRGSVKTLGSVEVIVRNAHEVEGKGRYCDLYIRKKD